MLVRLIETSYVSPDGASGYAVDWQAEPASDRPQADAAAEAVAELVNCLEIDGKDGTTGEVSIYEIEVNVSPESLPAEWGDHFADDDEPAWASDELFEALPPPLLHKQVSGTAS